MKKITIYSIIFVALFSLAGCAGRDFVRPSSDEYRLGVTTYGQVIQKMGDPKSSGVILKNGKDVKRIAYAYATRAGEPLEEGVIPARQAAFFFYKDLLIGREYISNFKADNTNFDETKKARIIKGKTSRDEVIASLGKPSAEYLYPVSNEPNGDAIGYSYATVRQGGPFQGLKYFRKFLMISFNEKGIVSDIEYSDSNMN